MICGFGGIDVFDVVGVVFDVVVGGAGGLEKGVEVEAEGGAEAERLLDVEGWVFEVREEEGDGVLRGSRQNVRGAVWSGSLVARGSRRV